MSTLLPIFIFSLLIAWISDYRSIYTYNALGERTVIKKDRLFFIILVLAMSVFIGLRLWCNDTGTYRETFEYLTSATGSILNNISWAIGDSPGFTIVNTVLKHLRFSTQSYLMFYAIATNALYLWFLRKYSTDLSFSVFLIWTMGVYMFTAAAMRQCIAIAIGLLGIDRALQKKWFSFILWILVASMFHPYALMFLMAPFLTYQPWTIKTWCYLGIFAILGFGLQNLVGVILDITTMMGKSYDADAFSGEGVNIFRLLVIWAPIVLSFLARNLMRESDDKADNLFMNFSMLNAEIMFVALFGTANYFARLANYFLIFQTLALPWMLKYFTKESQRLLKMIIVFCYMMYFLYTYTIYTPFDSYFVKMSLWEYIKSLY